MFELDKAVREWRRQMAHQGITSASTLDELESHLGEEVEKRVKAGMTDETAFEAAKRQLGQPDALTNEFAKVGETNSIVARVKYFVHILFGGPEPILASNMNTSLSNRNPAPAWATYIKSGAFALPALVLWLFVAVFVFPKFNEVLSGSKAWMPGPVHAGWDLALLLRHYLLPVGAACAVSVALLEGCSVTWRRYRKLALATAAFLLNSAVLIAITVMVVLSLCAAGALANHVK